MMRMVMDGLMGREGDEGDGTREGRHYISDPASAPTCSGAPRGCHPRGRHPSPSAHENPTIVDAYCGVGTFARLLAPYAGKVIAIEESASAIRDARWNLREVNNVEILQGKVEELLPSLGETIDGLVIDPPRAGCQPAVLDALARHGVRRIVYVSCDPSTLARDLHILCHVHSAYHLRSVQPLDMFPHTAHIECVAILEKQPANELRSTSGQAG